MNLFCITISNSVQTKLTKELFRELPYNGQNICQCHGSFNNLLPIENLPSKKYLDRLPSLSDIDLFSLSADNVINSDLEYSSIPPVRCKYYSPLKPRPNDRNMPTQHIATMLGATCCVLATVLPCVATCWVLLAQI